jgi:hypothetical protein
MSNNLKAYLYTTTLYLSIGLGLGISMLLMPQEKTGIVIGGIIVGISSQVIIVLREKFPVGER